MIDTIRFHIESVGFRESERIDLEQWSVNCCDFSTVSPAGNGRGVETTMTGWPALSYQHRPTGLRVMGPGHPQAVEVSLPRIVHGQNARLVRDQEQLTRAYTVALALVDQVVVGRFGQPVLKRIDLVHQFRHSPAAWLASFRTCRHPYVRRQGDREEYNDGRGITWHGKENLCRMYDKLREKKGWPGDIMRAEWQFRGKSLERRVGLTEDRFTRWSDLYRVYRESMLFFQPVHLPKLRERAIASICAFANSQNWSVRETGESLQSVVEQQMRETGCSQRRFRQFRREVASWRPEHSGIDLVALLPPDGPADFPEIDLWDERMTETVHKRLGEMPDGLEDPSGASLDGPDGLLAAATSSDVKPLNFSDELKELKALIG